jgi:hypothetical protein
MHLPVLNLAHILEHPVARNHGNKRRLKTEVVAVRLRVPRRLRTKTAALATCEDPPVRLARCLSQPATQDQVKARTHCGVVCHFGGARVQREHRAR